MKKFLAAIVMLGLLVSAGARVASAVQPGLDQGGYSDQASYSAGGNG